MKPVQLKISESAKAISPVIATLLMIAIAVVASLVTYAWVMGYFGTTTTKTGEAIIIQSSAATGSGLDLYVQNVGQGSVTFNPIGSVYVSDQLQNLQASDFDKTTLTPGETIRIQTHYPSPTDGSSLRVKVVTTSGTFSQISGFTQASTSASNPPQGTIFWDDFESGNLDKWSEIDTDPRSALNVVSVIMKDGTQVAQHALANMNDAYASIGCRDLGSSYSTIYMKGNYQLSALPAPGQTFSVGNFLTDANYNLLTNLLLTNNGGMLQWKLRYLTNVGLVDPQPVALANTPQPNTWFSFESMFKAGNGDGEVRVWINGQEVFSITGLTNSGYSVTKAIVDFGNVDSATTALFYSDSVFVSQQRIG